MASRFLLSIYIYYWRNCKMNSVSADIEFHKEDRRKQCRPCFQRCVFSPERWRNAAFIHSLPSGWRWKKIVFHKLWLFEDAGKPFCPFRDLLQRKKIHSRMLFFPFFLSSYSCLNPVFVERLSVCCLIVLLLKPLTMWNMKKSCSNEEAAPA